MNPFAIMSVTENPALNMAVEREFPGASLKLAPNTWLVAARGLTTREVSEKVGVMPEGISGVVVVKIEGYFGFAPRNIWEWLKVKTTEAPGGQESEP